MPSPEDYSVEDEIADVGVGAPHVVVLGAGASRACCPNGDKNGKSLPLMADFAVALGVDALLSSWGFNPLDNFEDTYSSLHDRHETDKLRELRYKVETYFSSLEIPEEPTIYDRLLLSLRPKDIVATFNWDPLLLQAYLRNYQHAPLPKPIFLHGNIMTGYCEADRTVGLRGHICSRCGIPFSPTPLLYPVRHKDYATDTFIASQWNVLKRGFKKAFMITIFGYSGPKTDREAILAMKDAWGSTDDRIMEQTSFITLQSYESWIANHPRRTGEAHFAQYYDAKFVENNPIPRYPVFSEIWNWYENLISSEKL
jgi:hypothetical protein